MEENTHLTPGQVAMCAEAMTKGGYENLPKEIRQHLVKCDQCSDEVNVVVETLIESEPELIHQKKNRRKTTLVVSLAASLTILVATVFVLKNQKYSSPVPQERQMAIVQEDTTLPIAEIEEIKETVRVEVDKKDEPQAFSKPKSNKIMKTPTTASKESQLLAYNTNEKLEKWAERYKDWNMRGESVVIKTPFLFETGKTFKLEWDNPKQETLIIELFNNNGEKIEEAEIDQNSYTPTTAVDPGLYYWKLINEDFDLLYCGKIKVK